VFASFITPAAWHDHKGFGETAATAPVGFRGNRADSLYINSGLPQLTNRRTEHKQGGWTGNCIAKQYCTNKNGLRGSIG
jgi:hypothetical protein